VDWEIRTAGPHRIIIVLLQDLFYKSWKKTAKIAKIRTQKNLVAHVKNGCADVTFKCAIIWMGHHRR